MGGLNGSRLWRAVAAAHACSLLTLLAFAAMTALPPGAPLALPGAAGLPLAWMFNLLVWGAPGVVVAGVAMRLRTGLPAGTGLVGGIALRLMLLAALAFAAQGAFALDPLELDAGTSRWHAVAWMLWNLAFAAGALLSGLALRAVRWPALLLAGVVGLCLLAPGLLGPGIAERVVLACWWAWTLWLAWRLPRR
ncbi:MULTISPECIES: hypothetical protein [Luteimonas]|uniref:hypothetical protein n=1 Tax=Luteimonas TaxID=83614 RepID=UPI000C7C6D6B|nr:MULTISPECIES: hypothetical protein [Luteimonas]